MTRKSFVLMVVGTVIFLLCSVSSADVPQMINYQGKLTTAQGGCLNDTVQMTFSIYSDDQGTVQDWTETQNSVIVKEGIFNVLLGSEDPIPASVFDGSTKYLGVKVESDPEMRPLKPMVSVGYAYTTENADKVDGYHAGNSSGQVAVSNGTKCDSLNADKLDDLDAGSFARATRFFILGGGGTTTFTIPHYKAFQITIGEAYADPSINAVGFVHCIGNDGWIAWLGYDGAGIKVKGRASLSGTTTILTLRAGNITLKTPGDGTYTLKVTSVSEDVKGIVVW